MFEQFRDLLLYLYQASEKMEEKTAIFSEEREKRREEFRKHKEEMKAKAAEKIKKMKNESKEASQKHYNELLKKAGIARTQDLEEVKKLLSEMSAKIDKLSK